jgi:hypothetical protein
MSIPSSDPQHIPGLDSGVSPPAPPRRPRHPLGLPAGSIRALLALMVLGLLWAVALMYEGGKEIPQSFVFLLYLMVLILGSYFAAHGNSIGGASAGERSPLGLPRGVIRLLLLGGFAGLVVWLYFNRPAFERELAVPAYMPLIMLGGFFLGYLVSSFMHAVTGGRGVPYWYQDLQAWVALIAGLLLVAYLLVQLASRNLDAEDQRAPLVLEGILAGFIGFYFGARS